MSKKQDHKSKPSKNSTQVLNPEDLTKNAKAKLMSKAQHLDVKEQEKNKTFIILEIIEYIPNSVVIKTIIKKTTGNVTVSSFDSGEALTENTSPFDTFIQVIDGTAEIVINGHSNV